MKEKFRRYEKLCWRCKVALPKKSASGLVDKRKEKFYNS